MKTSAIQDLLRAGPFVWIGIFTALMFSGAFLWVALESWWKKWRNRKNKTRRPL